MNIYFGSMASVPGVNSHVQSSRISHAQKLNNATPVASSSKPHTTLTNALSLLTGASEISEPAPARLNVALRRHSSANPWGFRVQGGSDYKLQLTVCKASTQSGSPSEGVLHRGDAIISINGESARNLSHEQATEKIKSSGTDLQLTIAR
ncbi:PDZ and LIM domain protein 2 [Fasciola hepatica]|uniref:PDZ and LIM domain protein 2 n=1 Tax=Fasciola hepatica TaxID=6192 RepID=A0A4E0RDD5_FASHE|nr:PDZ and LIM domain protein 2 [Fasciola hepatica]